MKSVSRKSLVTITLIVMNLSLFESSSHAGIIETDALLQTEQADSLDRTQQLDRASRFLMQDKVGQALMDLGVSPEQVLMRIKRLTDVELQQLVNTIDHAPAGAGVVEVVGIVFIVLIILELVGVTDIFKKL